MALNNKSMYAILGILNVAPSTGYEIKKYCDRVLAGFWNENYGHLYPTLKRLLKEKLIATDANEDEERKICYHITKKGQKELAFWLTQQTKQQPVRSEFMLKLLFSNERPTKEVLDMLLEYRRQYELEQQQYQVMLQNLEQGIEGISENRASFLRAVLRRGMLSAEATIKWCDETIEEIGRQS